MLANNTPVIIGVGQYSEKVDKQGYESLSYMDLAGRSLSAAITDSGVGHSAELAAAIDVLAAIRAFEISRPCLLYTSPSPRDGLLSRMPSSA